MVRNSRRSGTLPGRHVRHSVSRYQLTSGVIYVNGWSSFSLCDIIVSVEVHRFANILT